MEAANIVEECIGEDNLEDVVAEGDNTVDIDDDFINLYDVIVNGELSDFLSSDSDLEDVPPKDSSDVDEELRAFRQERRNIKQRKKAIETEEIPVGQAGRIDRGFEDIGKDKD